MGELIVYDTFLEWFSGFWNNQRQAYSNPRGQAYVNVIHELEGDTFYCSYRHKRQPRPYRYFEAKTVYNDGEIILKNPTQDLIFKLDGGSFVSKSDFTHNGIRYINEAYLGRKHYHVKDQGFDLKTGKQLWGLDDNRFYEFDRN